MNEIFTKLSAAVAIASALAASVQAQETIVRPDSVSVSGAATFFSANNLINGSGLNSPLNSGDTFAAGINHNWSVAVSSDSWLSTDPGGFPSDYFAVMSGVPVFITFDLGVERVLNMAHFWAYSGSSGVAGAVQGDSARTIELRFNSAAAGSGSFLGPALTFDLNHGPSSGTPPGNVLSSQDFSLGADFTARYVEMRITDNWYVAPGDGSGSDIHGDFVRGGNRVGLGEVRFGFAPYVSPTVATLPASAVVGTYATLNGTANPSGYLAFGFFEWGTTTNYGNATPARSLGSGGSDTNFSQAVGVLPGGVTYHFRAVASNSFIVVEGTNQSFTTPVFTDLNSVLVAGGYLTKLRFDNIGNSTNVSDLLNHTNYLNDQPDFKSLREDFSANDTNECDHCGYVVRGLFIPTATGPHTFYIAADDGAVLFLSTDESPTNKVQIAREPVWAVRRNYIGEAEGGGRGDPPVNRSLPITLTNGARYYIEGVVKEGSGGDNLDVAVEGPGDAPVADGDRPIFGNRIATTRDLPGVSDGSVAWGDFDNDGDLDILLAGEGNNDSVNPNQLIARVYRNNGNGTFTDLNAGLPGVSSPSVAWGDFDNDGNLDILLTGLGTNYFPIARVYRNNGNGTFTDLNAGLPGVFSGSVAWGDFDNDGDLDILLTGFTTYARIARVYRNNGDGTFTDLNAGLHGVESSSVAWGDFDNDGDLDILLTGLTDSGPIDYVPIARVYRNNGNGTFTDLINAVLPGVYYGSVAWGDFDNDGDLDILLTGSTNYTSSGRVARAYRNNGNGTFTDLNAGLPGVRESSVAWGDFDNDGDLDILLTG